MVNSDAYDSTDGNFGPKEGYYIGSHPYATTNDNDGSKKFCIEFANTLNNVEEQCTNFANTLQTGITIQNFDDATSAETSTAIDAKCAASSLTTAVNVKTQMMFTGGFLLITLQNRLATVLHLPAMERQQQ